MLESVIQNFPLWAVALLLLGACILAREAGVLFYRWQKARRPDGDESGKDAESHVVTAVFGLLAFVIALSFSFGMERFEVRRQLVVEEANAISTTYLRAGLFDEPYRTQLRSTLRDYAHSRIVPDGLWDARLEKQLRHTLGLRDRLWLETQAAVYPVRETELASYFLDSANEVLNVGTRRQLAGRAHIPTRIMAVMFLYLIAASAVLGYLLGDKPGRRRQATTVLMLLFAVVILTVLDLDRPQAGAIQVPQRALEELVVTLDREAPRSPPSTPTP